MKRRSSSAVSQACESPSVKRTRVQAQRKFASNNSTYSGSRIMTRTLEDYKVPVVTIPINSPEQEECELNTFSSLPAVDDLLTFLCFRDTEVLPARLDYLSSPQFDPLPPPAPLPKKYSKTNDASVLPTNNTSKNVIGNEKNKLENKGEPDYRGSKKLDEYKKLRSRCLTGINKASRSLALKHNQRLRSKNVVKAKLCESQLKSKSISTPENAISSVSNGRATRTSARGRIETEYTKSASPVKRVTRQNLGCPDSLNTSKELPSRVKSVTPSRRMSSLITNKLPIRLENTSSSSASLPLPKLNIESCSETSATVLKKTETSTKPHTRSARNAGYELEVDLGSARPKFIRSAAIKRASQFPIRTTRSSGALRDETLRDSHLENKTEDVVPSYTRPSRRTKEAATFYMEILGKELLCPGSDDDDSCSVESFPELPSTDSYLRRVRELEKQHENNSPEKVALRKMSGPKMKSTNLSSSQVKSSEKLPANQVTETAPVEIRNRRYSKESLTHCKDKPTSRRASAVLEPINSASDNTQRNCALRRASESDEVKQLNERSTKFSTSQVAKKLSAGETSEILDSKNSNERAAKSSTHPAPGSSVRRASRILESKNSFEQPTKSVASPVAPKASEIQDTEKLNKQSASCSIGQATAKPTPQRAREIVETRYSNEQSTKSSTSQVIMKPSRRAAADILLQTSAGSSTGQVIVKTLSRKASKILSLKNSDRPILKSSAIELPTKPLLRRASEGLASKDPTEPSTKSSTSQIAAKSMSRRASEILIPPSCSNQSSRLSMSQATAQSIPRTASLAHSFEQPEKLSSDKFTLKPAPRRPSEILEFGRSREQEKLVSRDSDASKVGNVTANEKVPLQDNTSPTTIEVTIKDLTKRQEPEKSVFKKKVVSMKTNSANVSKENPCKKLGTQIRDLTKTSSVEMIRMIAKDSPEKDNRESSSISGAVKTSNSDRRCSLSTDTEATVVKRNESSSPVDVSKMVNVNSAEKKIFRKSEKELLRRSDAFSPDNEKSVYAFEPDLPTSSPPFRRLKPVTPPKMLSVNNAVAVQVNFGKDGQVECASAGDTRLSSTTDSEGDRVFYIPIETSAAATSTLGFAVKLDGPNPKILMSIITNSPAFTTNTVTDVQAKSVGAESICAQTDAVRSSSKVEQATVTVPGPSAIGGSVNEPTIKRKVMPKSSPSKRQPVMIVKCKKRKKVGQGTNVNLTNSTLEPKPTFTNEKVERNTVMDAVQVKSGSVPLNQTLGNAKVKPKSICEDKKVDRSTNIDLVQAKSEPVLVDPTVTDTKPKPRSIFIDRKVDWSTNKSGPVSTNPIQTVHAINLTSEQLDSKLKRPHKRVEITHQVTHADQETTEEILDEKLDPAAQNKTVEVLHQSNKDKNTDIVDRTTTSHDKTDKDQKEKLPMSGELTKVLHSASGSKKVNSHVRLMNDQSNDTPSSRAAPLSVPPSTSTKSSVPNKSFAPIVKASRSKKVDSSDSSSGADTPVPADVFTHNVDVVAKKNAVEMKPAKVEIPETKVKGIKVKARPQKTKDPEPSSSSQVKVSKSPGKILEAPTFRPTKEEFNDPLEYIESIRPEAEKFGLCRIVPPSDFRPECKVADEMRFTAYNQYVHKMLHRWGPNVKEMLAIKKFLATQNIELTQMPWIGGMEVDLPRLYQTVQQCGGLSAVIESGRWQSVADMMRIPKLAQDRITKLDDIYCKYLLPYDILSHEERERIFDDIEKEWAAHLKKSSDEDLFEDVDECVLKGRTMPLSCFYRIARNTMMMCFGTTDGHQGPSTETIEREFWKHVSDRKAHICVHSGSIDSGTHGYGFSVAKNSTFRKHPWNLKVLTNNAASILRFLGPVMGVTVPTLHVGMLYSAFCWYRDPHGLPWIEYLHTGAEKIWYGIPDEHSENFREAMLAIAPRFCRDKKIWLSSDTVMIPPRQLIAESVSLSRVVQQPGQFIVVFPKAFTSSISTGYLVSESVYFAQASWLDSAKQIFTDMRDSCEPSVFSLEQLVINIAEDTRPNVSILTKILPLLNEILQVESHLRNQLKERGVNIVERLNTNKKRKSKSPFPEEEYYECDVCHSNLFVSTVANSLKENFYCLQHAIAMFQRKSTQAKHYKLLYAYSEAELTELVDKVKSRIETKNAKK